MAFVCLPISAAITTWLCALLYLSCFFCDWWVLTGENRANLFKYTMSTPESIASSISESWYSLCRRGDSCRICKIFTWPKDDCDPRPATYSCLPKNKMPANMCFQLNHWDCVELWTTSCIDSVSAHTSNLQKIPTLEDSCPHVSDLHGACPTVTACAGMIGTTMCFSLFTAAIVVVYWVRETGCCGRKPQTPKPGQPWILGFVLFLTIQFVFGLTGFSLGHMWTHQLPFTEEFPGLWCALCATILNLLAVFLFGLIAVMNARASRAHPMNKSGGR